MMLGFLWFRSWEQRQTADLGVHTWINPLVDHFNQICSWKGTNLNSKNKITMNSPLNGDCYKNKSVVNFSFAGSSPKMMLWVVQAVRAAAPTCRVSRQPSRRGSGGTEPSPLEQQLLWNSGWRAPLTCLQSGCRVRKAFRKILSAQYRYWECIMVDNDKVSLLILVYISPIFSISVKHVMQIAILLSSETIKKQANDLHLFFYSLFIGKHVAFISILQL